MKKKVLLLSALTFLLLLSLSDIQAQSKKSEIDSALLYEITGRDLKRPSYLFGTIHLICQKDMFPAEKLKSYLNQTEQLLLEFDMDDPATVQKAVKASMLPDGKTLKDYVTPEEYAKIDELFKDYLGVSFDVLQTYKPLVSRTYLLSSPKVLGCQPPTVYDNFLAQAAVAAKMPVIGLETVEQQIAVIDSEPLEKQIKALNEAVANPEKDFNDFKSLYQTYLTQNSDAVYKQIVSQMKADYDLKKFLDERNLNWIPVIEKNMASKPSFVAVGGGHLGGKKGVVKLLRAKGYRLKPIRF
jgi:uncharacterized protein YbaP (TraB family)